MSKIKFLAAKRQDMVHIINMHTIVRMMMIDLYVCTIIEPMVESGSHHMNFSTVGPLHELIFIHCSLGAVLSLRVGQNGYKCPPLSRRGRLGIRLPTIELVRRSESSGAGFGKEPLQ